MLVLYGMALGLAWGGLFGVWYGRIVAGEGWGEAVESWLLYGIYLRYHRLQWALLTILVFRCDMESERAE